MTAFATPRPRSQAAASALVRPAEGWLSLAALLVMLAVMALAVDDARWAGTGLEGRSQTAFLATDVLLAALWGFAGAKLRWPSLLVHIVGAIAATAFLIVAVAAAIPAAPSDGLAPITDDPLRVVNLMRSLVHFLHDVLVLQIRSDQTSAFLLVVGGVAWASAQFAAFAIYRRHRPMSAVMLLGLLLLASMSLTVKDQFWFLVVFSLAALLLLVRLSLAEQRGVWAHGRLGDEAAAFGLYLRNGVAFIVVALIGALLLTSNASSDPLRGLWNGTQDQLLAWGLELDRIAGGITGAARGPSGLFSSADTIRGFWAASDEPVLTVRSSDGHGYYLRGATYDDFDGHTWRQLDRAVGPTVTPGGDLLTGTADAVKEGKGRRSLTLTFTPKQWVGDVLLSPPDPVSTTRAVQLVTAGDAGAFSAVTISDPIRPGVQFQVTALVRSDPALGGVTGNQLAAAGTSYPEWARRYVAVQAGSIGPVVKETADRLVGQLAATQRDPFHIATAFQEYLYGGHQFTYDTDVQGRCPASMSVADCLLTQRHGYCEYFATTMVMMLRTQQIPARYVVGYLPGRSTDSGAYTVTRSAAHAWVEVYFPAIGWIQFDPTPGNVENGQTPTELPAGPAVATPSPVPGSSAGPARTPSFGEEPNDAAPRRSHPPQVAGTAGSSGGTPPATLIGAGVLGTGILAVVFVTVILPRRRRRILSPEAAYTGIARLATRFGYSPRPAQTVYEYTEMLGSLVPAALPDLQFVARAKVESTYGHRALAGVRVRVLASAYGRLRVSLLRLALRYRRRRRG
jgi:transglutaminase-like putative cysteine protease